MNKLFFGRVGVKILWKYILCKLSRDHHVTIMWPVNSFYLFVNYFTVISLQKLNFAKREHLNFFRLQQWAYVLRTYGRRPVGDVKWLSKKILLKSRNSIFENHKNGDHLDKLYLHIVVAQNKKFLKFLSRSFLRTRTIFDSKIQRKNISDDRFWWFWPFSISSR